MRVHGPQKSATAFRTISEVSDELDLPQHVLRFWETKFPQVRPLKRGGGRRYYRPEDVDLLRRIQSLLYKEGYTIRGVQRLLRETRGAAGMATTPEPGPVAGGPEDAPSGGLAAGDEAGLDDVGPEAGPDAGSDGGGHDDHAADEGEPLILPDEVRRDLVTVLEELYAIRALLGRTGD